MCTILNRGARDPRARRLRVMTLLALGALAAGAHAATVSERAKEMHCTSRAEPVAGTTLYKCQTASAPAFFSVDAGAPAPGATSGNGSHSDSGVAPVPGPARSAGGFPRVDPQTQKGRDDVRRRVLQDELAAEEKLLAQSRTEYADGAPPPLAEERANSDKYRERIARLRQAVTLHERNVEALRKEIAGLR